MDKILLDAHERIRDQALLMRKHLTFPESKLPLALHHCGKMLEQLRVRDLPPKSYYELYNACFDVLSQLQNYLIEVHRKHHLAEVYALVEYTSRVLPRLYLMITVGSAFLATNTSPEVEVLADMIGMVKAEQSPLIGLFLRYYLSQSTGEFVSKHASENTQFYTNWVLSNFIEMNKLWVRYQTSGDTLNYDRRSQEREQLQTIVGSNILRLAQMDCVGNKMFCLDLLPRMLVQVVQCRDRLAQEYLLDVIVQAFPAEYHYDSLEIFLDCLPELNRETSLFMIIQNSMNRLKGYADVKREEFLEWKRQQERKQLEKEEREREEKKEDEKSDEKEQEKSDEKEDGETGDVRTQTTGDVEKTKTNDEVPISTTTPTSPPPINRTTSHESASIPQQFETESEEFKKQEAIDTDAEFKHDVNINNKVSQLNDLKEPVPPKVNGLNLNDLPKHNVFQPLTEIGVFFQDAVRLYWACITHLNVDSITKIALVRQFIDFTNAVETSCSVDLLVSFISKGGLPQSMEVEHLLLALFDILPNVSEVLRILREHPDLTASQSKETKLVIADKVIDSLIKNQAAINSVDQCKSAFDLLTILFKSGDTDPQKIVKLVNCLRGQDPMVTLDLLQLARRSLRAGGHHVIANSYNLLAVNAIPLLSITEPASVVKIAKFCYQLCTDLANIGHAPSQGFRLFLVCANSFDSAMYGDLSHEMFAGALSIYEEFISNSREQFLCLTLFIHCLQQVSSVSNENYVIASKTCVKNCSTLLKKQDQCRLLLQASHLYWDNKYSNAQQVLEIVSKALRSADAVMDRNDTVELFLEVLETEIYYFGNGCKTITEDTIQNIFCLISENMSNADLDGKHNKIMDLKHKLDRISSFIEHQTDEFPQFVNLLDNKD